MKKKYQEAGLEVIGIHTPEFDFEKDRGRVERAVDRYKIDYPVFMDNDYAYWNSLNNRYWPSFYLVDRKGHIRTVGIGELHEGTVQGSMMEEMIKSLLGEDEKAS